MKNISFAGIAVSGMFCLALPASAQNPINPPTLSAPPSGFHEIVAWVPESMALVPRQDSITLDPAHIPAQARDSAVDTNLLREPSIYRKISKSETAETSEEALLKDRMSVLSATYREAAKPSAGKDCMEIALSVNQRINLNSTTVLEIVEMEVAASPACVCEIVKSAIRATDAEPELVAGIVETALLASPENMRLISQCAIAEAPESLAAVQTLLAKLDPNGGDSETSSKSPKSAKSVESSKSAKASTDAIVDAVRTNMGSNPLNLPPLHVITPPPVLPPHITQVDP